MSSPETDIDPWLGQLAGGDAASESVEARVLRAAVRTHATRVQQQLESSHGLDAGEEHALQRLRFRLKQENLLRRPAPAWTLWASAAMAAVLVVAVGIRLYPAPVPSVTYAVSYDQPPVYRGSVNEVAVSVKKPLESARRLATLLGSTAAQPQLYVWQNTVVVDFDATPELLARLETEMQTLQIPSGSLRSGLNRLIFRAP